MKRSEAFPSQYLSKDDVSAGPIRRTIADVQMQTIKGDTGEEDKPVMVFAEAGSKGMVLNNTNWETIAVAYGDDTEAWKGQAIELYLDPGVMFGAKRVGGVRIRVPGSRAATKPTPSSAGKFWTLAAAVAECASRGISKDQLGTKMKSLGFPAWNNATCTPVLWEWLAEIDAANAGEEESPTGDEIPF